MSFQDILGQDNVVKFLKSSLLNKRLHHAYLFIGDIGVGKLLTAKNFAKAVNCLLKNDDACDVCTSCLKIDSEKSPDVFFMKGSKEDCSFGIDDIRNLQHFITLKPFESKKKIFILEDISRMTLDASNAFLKTLEEPPRDSIIILLSHDKSKILPTVFSRCEAVQFLPLSRELIRDLILKRFNIDAKSADYITHFVGGSFARSSDYAKIADILNWKNAAIDSLNNLRPYEDISAFGENKQALLKSLEVLIYWYRDLLLAKLDLNNLIVNRDRLGDISDKSDHYEVKDLLDCLKYLEEAYYQVNSNVNSKLSMSVLKMELDEICMR